MSKTLSLCRYALALSLTFAPFVSLAETVDTGIPLPRIVNGLTSHDFPTTGALLLGGNPATASTNCTGTLIGCETFLTAAHCVEDDLNPSAYTVFFQHAGFFSVTSVEVHPSYSFPVADVAVLKLGSMIDGISPTPIDTVGGHANGTSGTIAGYGRTGGGAFDYGIKRFGDVSIASCQFGVSNTTSICWDFDTPVGPAGDDSNTCNADSGGPLFIDSGLGPVVAGITSGGNSSDCLAFDSSFDTRVSFYAGYIQTEGGADINNITCGTLPQVGDSDVDVIGFEGTVNGGTPQDTNSFVVDAGAMVLRVNYNGHDDGVSDFDMYVRAGSPPTTSTFDCAATGSNQYGSCEFSNPSSGTWYVMVDRQSGAGSYQVTATSFGTFCSDPGNNGLSCDDENQCTSGDICLSGACVGTPSVNGTSCDDGNTCTTPDTCQAGVCTGSSMCGDGVIQTSCEECDDGAATSGDGCASDCSVEACYECAGEPSSCGAPSGCSNAPKSVLVISDVADSSKDKVIWKWIKGTTSTASFGDPVMDDGYDMCVWEDGALSSRASVAKAGSCGSKPCWKTLGSMFAPAGYKYKNKSSNGDGVFQVLLKEGVGKGKILWKGRGSNLMLPGPASGTEYFSGTSLMVQAVRDDGGACWQADFDSTDFKKNDPDKFKAVAK